MCLVDDNFSISFSSLKLQVETTIEHICRHDGDGALLVFLTGWDEISKLLEKIKGNNYLGNPSRFLVLPLHGSMPTVNQREIFDRPPRNMRQVLPLDIYRSNLLLVLVYSIELDTSSYCTIYIGLTFYQYKVNIVLYIYIILILAIPIGTTILYIGMGWNILVLQ